MAAAKKAASYGKRVILFDFVKPRYLNNRACNQWCFFLTTNTARKAAHGGWAEHV